MKIFLDCGSNIGQAYTHFRDRYGDKYRYMLFEPNPHCYGKLIEQFGKLSNVEIHNEAAYTENCIKPFYFETEYSVGGSIIQAHNGAYNDCARQEVMVNCVDIVEVIKDLSLNNELVIKFDIESSEYDVLEQMINSKVVFMVNKIYCEFHCKYMKKKDKSVYKPREDKIMSFMRQNNIDFEIWH